MEADRQTDGGLESAGMRYEKKQVETPAMAILIPSKVLKGIGVFKNPHCQY